MPFPIMPIGADPKRGKEEREPFPVELLLQTSALVKQADASDTEAEMLYSLWGDSRIVSGGDEITQRVYALPQGYSNEKLFRLKAAGLLSGDDKAVRFSLKAARVIKTMILGEKNAFEKQSVKKPYSVILAESKLPRTRSKLSSSPVMGF